jgi:lipopolysaccharide O-acetyltransferase
MNPHVAERVIPNRAMRFLQENGTYIFASELQRRAGILFRRWLLSRKLGCPNIILGPRCHLRGLSHIAIGKNFQAAEGLWLEAVTDHEGCIFAPRIRIGNDVSISRWSHIGATNLVEIGDGVLIGSKVLITDHSHGQYSGPHTSPLLRPVVRPLVSDREVIIERNVWLGDGVVVGPGSRIGEGAVIGANAVVAGNIPPFTLAVGVPAKPRKRFSFETNEWVDIR